MGRLVFSFVLPFAVSLLVKRTIGFSAVNCRAIIGTPVSRQLHRLDSQHYICVRPVPRRSTGETLLYNERRNDEDGDAPTINSDYIFADVVAIFLACQLLGLLDVLNDSDFWSSGGWLQPIPAAPRSLPTLVQRTALNSVVYLCVSVPLDMLRRDSKPTMLMPFLRFGPAFLLARILAELAVQGVALDNTFDSNLALELARESYFVVLFIATARYCYSLLYRQ